MNKVLEQQELRDTWGHSKLSAYDIIEYQGEGRDAKKLAAYFTKESNITVREGKQKVRYVASRNLKKPEVQYQTIQSKKWRERPTAKKGYALIDVMNTFTGWGYPLQIARYAEMEKKKSEGGRMSKICPECGKSFNGSQGQKYCSYRCCKSTTGKQKKSSIRIRLKACRSSAPFPAKSAGMKSSSGKEQIRGPSSAAVSARRNTGSTILPRATSTEKAKSACPAA